MRRHLSVATGLVVALLTSACIAEETPPTMTASPTDVSSPTPSIAATPTEGPTPSASPTPTPQPSLVLEPPEETDARVVTASVVSDVGDATGTLTVTVTSLADERIDELVLRWPTELSRTLDLAPFTPSEDRIRDGGPPLVQPWTKWVVGPGEQGEPEGTISLGWGPLLAGATLSIELDATRREAGPVAFDLQLLAGERLLTLEGGDPAELRVEVP
ncbi:MAG TPA: hypothetical protein VF364_05965 [Candidatus Limnocylindria bacterium]